LLIHLLAKNGNAQYANVLYAPSGTFVSSLSSALVLVCRDSEPGILQFGQRIDQAYHPAGEEVRRWVQNQPNTREDPSWQFRLTVFSMDIDGTTGRSS
jgi:hypothetical protein